MSPEAKTLQDIAIELAEDKDFDVTATRRVELCVALVYETDGVWPCETIADLRDYVERKQDRITELEAIIKELDPDYWQKKALALSRVEFPR